MTASQVSRIVPGSAQKGNASQEMVKVTTAVASGRGGGLGVGRGEDPPIFSHQKQGREEGREGGRGESCLL